MDPNSSRVPTSPPDSDARRREAALRLALEAGRMGVWHWDLANDRGDMSPEIARLHGLDPAAAPLTFDQYLQIVHPDDRAHVRQAIEDGIRTGTGHDVEYRILKPDGDVRWMLGKGSTERDRSGRPVLLSGVCVDITSRKAAEQHVLRLARVLDSMSEGVSISNEAGVILYTNPAEDRLFGYEPGELVGRHVTIQNTYPPDENRRIVAEVIAQLQRTGLWKGEFSNIRKDGTTFTTQAHITSLESDGERYWVCVQQDITARKHAEDELRKRDERHRAFLATSTEAIWRFELDEPIPTDWETERQIEAIFARAYLAECNDAMARMYGYDDCNDLTGVRLHQMLVPTEPANRAYLRAFIESGYRLTGHESHEVDRFGRPRVFRNSLVGVIDDGRIARAWGTQTDITDQKHAEAQLRESEARFRRLAEREAFLANAGKVLTSSLNHRDTLQRVADLAVPYLGDYCAVDMIAPDLSVERIAVAHRDPTRLERVLETARRWPVRLDRPGAVTTVFETRQTLLVQEIPADLLEANARDAEHKAFLESLGLRSVIVTPLVARGHVLGFLTLVCAESDRRYSSDDARLAEELAARAAIAIDNARLYEEAQTANRAKDDFLARLSHELRTPINAALGWTQLLRVGADPAQLERGLTIIDRNTRALATMIEDLMEFSRNVRTDLKIEPRAIDLRGVVQHAITSVEPLLAQKGVELRLVDGEGISCVCDAARMQQVIWNLLTNAIKFTPAGGTISVSLHEHGDSIELAVTDSGEGIQPELLESIFDPFRQGAVHATGGLGLGLAIVRQIVEAHGGTVSASSDGPGTGARFTVRLPRA